MPRLHMCGEVYGSVSVCVDCYKLLKNSSCVDLQNNAMECCYS